MDLSAFSARGSVVGKCFAHGVLKRLPRLLAHSFAPCLKGGLLGWRGIRTWHPVHGAKIEAEEPAQPGRHMADALITERAAQPDNDRKTTVRRQRPQRGVFLVSQRVRTQMLPQRCKIEVTEQITTKGLVAAVEESSQVAKAAAKLVALRCIRGG